MSEQHTKLLVIGAGPAGYTAAIYAARAALEPILVQGMQPGGQLTITTEIENFPGFADPVQGPWLMEQMSLQAERMGTKLIYDVIKEIDTSARPFRCTAESGETFIADTIIIATGAQAKWLGIPSEEKFQGHGVSGCATCDGFFYRGKEVLVVGGGNTALEEALYLTHHANKVTLIHRRDSFRGEKIMQDRVAANPKIEIMWDTEIAEIIGDEQPALSVTGARLRNTKTGEESSIAAEGIFIAIGHKPATEVFKGKINMDAEGYIITEPDSTKTNIPGIFAAGDVKDKTYRQAVTAAGMGCMASLEVEKFLAENN